MPRDDPVVERVRAAGRKIAQSCGWDPHALVEWARKVEAEFPERVVGYEYARRSDRWLWKE